MTQFICQDAQNPSLILDGIGNLFRAGQSSLCICVAYTTAYGLTLLKERAEFELGVDVWEALPKRIVTSVDYGITSPEALRLLRGLANAEVLVANPGVIERARFNPRIAFHPKCFCVEGDASQAILTGSANLTRRAMTVNTEAAIYSEQKPLVDQFLTSFERLAGGATEVDDDWINQYEIKRNGLPEVESDDEVEAVEPPENPPPLIDFVNENENDLPARFWIEAGSMSSSGSRHQLELPRRACHFFNLRFANYVQGREEIGTITLVKGHASWNDRRIVWHGDNGMERLYLPTVTQGGVNYVDQAVLFEQRETGEFGFQVVPWNSDVAASWRNASIEAGLIFTVAASARANSRICGFLP
jgi:HKD family nuclease